jgi:tetratricopeptide (TPR) repeat protein
MRTRKLARTARWLGSLFTLLLCGAFAVGVAHAQGKGGAGKGAQDKGAQDKGGASKGGKKEINLDEEEDDAQIAGEGPVAAGQMTEEAAQAKQLFDNERWSEAALALKRVVDGETGDDEGNKQIAAYHLAISLYRLKFFQASYAIFQEISKKPSHLKGKETLLWLAKLATQLPEPADIIGAVGRYSKDEIQRFDNPQQRELYWQLNYLHGRHEYRKRKFEEAIQLFEKVAKESPYFVKSQFFLGISNVQLRRSVPAVRAFQRIIDAIDEGVEGVEDEQRMRDLAYLSMARTFYSASIRLDQSNVPTIDDKKLSAAVKYWNLVESASEYWLDALFEESWAYFMAGDYPRALGNIHTIQSPYFPNAFYPEAEIVRAVIAFTTCQYEDATVMVAKFQKKWEPINKELDAVLDRFKGEGSEEKFYEFLLQVRDGKADLSPAIKPIVENALSDRELLRNVEYVRILDEETKRLGEAPTSFKNSPVGADVEDNVNIARADAVRRAGVLARKRYQRNLDELKEHLRSSQKILVDINNAQRQKLDEEIATGQFTQEDAFRFGRVTPDEEHVIWPFNGEYWRDELGFYRQVVNSNCGQK